MFMCAPPVFVGVLLSLWFMLWFQVFGMLWCPLCLRLKFVLLLVTLPSSPWWMGCWLPPCTVCFSIFSNVSCICCMLCWNILWMLSSKVVCLRSASLTCDVVGVWYGLVWVSLSNLVILGGGVYIWNSCGDVCGCFCGVLCCLWCLVSSSSVDSSCSWASLPYLYVVASRDAWLCGVIVSVISLPSPPNASIMVGRGCFVAM